MIYRIQNGKILIQLHFIIAILFHFFTCGTKMANTSFTCYRESQFLYILKIYLTSPSFWRLSILWMRREKIFVFNKVHREQSIKRSWQFLKYLKELGFYHIIFALSFIAHNICWTHTTPSILIFANALR